MQIHDEITTGTFGIELGKSRVETAQAVSGFTGGQDVVSEQVTPTGQHLTHRQPGADRAGEVTITRGRDKSAQFTNWIEKTMVNCAFDSAIPNIAITVMDGQEQPVRRIHLFNAWASNLQGPSLDADSAGPATETVTIVYEDVRVETV